MNPEPILGKRPKSFPIVSPQFSAEVRKAWRERLGAEQAQRDRLNERFAKRKPSPPTADFDLPYPQDAP